MNKYTYVPFKIFLLWIGLFYAGIGVAQQLDPRLLNYPDSVVINGKIVSMDDGGVNENVGTTY